MTGAIDRWARFGAAVDRRASSVDRDALSVDREVASVDRQNVSESGRPVRSTAALSVAFSLFCTFLNICSGSSDFLDYLTLVFGLTMYPGMIDDLRVPIVDIYTDLSMTWYK